MRSKGLKAITAAWMILAMIGLSACRGAQRQPELPPQAPPEGAGWMNLLSPEHAGHWEELTGRNEIFSIENGELTIHGRFLPLPLRYVAYKGQEFGDFELHIDFKVTRRANSGVFLRSNPDDPVGRGMEVQVLDSYGDRPHHHGAGSVYDVITPMFNPSMPVGEWNSYRIRLEGDELEVVFNGIKVIDADLSQLTMPIGKFDTPYAELPKEGLIMLQDHGGEVYFRNIFVREL